MKQSIILLFLITTFWATAQDKNWKHISRNDIALASVQFVGGFADGTNQAIIYHRLGRFSPFWDYKYSWKRKYKDFDNGDKREAFALSSSVLVGFTDGNHLTRMIDRNCQLASIVIGFTELRDYPKKDRWKVISKKLLLSVIANRLAFYASYDGLFKFSNN